MDTFSEYFISNPGKAYSFQGNLVWGYLEIPVVKNTRLRITILSHIRTPRQVLSFATRGCFLAFVDDRTRQAHIHADSKPTCYMVDFDSIGRESYVRLWNSWKVKADVEFGLNYAGMIITPLDGQSGTIYHCKCSDGVGDPDFQSLVFECEVIRSEKPADD